MTATSLQPARRPEAPRAPELVVARDTVDLATASTAVSDLLVALGQDPTSEHLRDTPRRVATALAESLTPTPFSMTTFANDDDYDEMVVVRDIAFHSLCAHHMLPFHGLAQVAYVPNERIVGLSKLARLVDHHSRRLQTQERLTGTVADALQTALDPLGVAVTMEATHLCMTMRGVHATGTTTVTTVARGLLRDDPATRSEYARITSVPARATHAHRGG